MSFLVADWTIQDDLPIVWVKLAKIKDFVVSNNVII